MKNFYKVYQIILFISLTINLYAKGFSWDFRVDTGLLNGEANELVYRTDGSKLSELIWGLEDVRLAGIGTSLNTAYNIKINFDFYMNYNEGKSTIEDYDWADTSISDWTHWSKSDTDITEVYKYDLNVELFSFHIKSVKYYFLAGYKEDIYTWKAYGGTYIYSSKGNFRDDINNFSDELLLSYRQDFRAPYIGLGSNYGSKRFDLEGEVLYGNNVDASDEDIHHARNLYFEDFFEDGEYFGISLKGKYNFTKSLSLIVSYDYEKYLLNKGWTKVTNLNTGYTSSYNYNSAGIENESSMYTVGLEYRY